MLLDLVLCRSAGWIESCSENVAGCGLGIRSAEGVFMRPGLGKTSALVYAMVLLLSGFSGIGNEWLKQCHEARYTCLALDAKRNS